MIPNLKILSHTGTENCIDIYMESFSDEWETISIYMYCNVKSWEQIFLTNYTNYGEILENLQEKYSFEKYSQK